MVESYTYVVVAYAIGFAAIFGFAGMVLWKRRRLRALLSTLESHYEKK